MTPRPIEMSQPLARRPEARFARYSLVLSFSAFSTAADFRRRLPAPGFTRYDAFDPSIVGAMNEAAGIHHARQRRREAAGWGPMMKQIARLLVTAASLAFAPNPSHAQSIMSPCMRVCEPPARLNTQNCSCEESTRTQPKGCALVCSNPDQKLDLRRCRCVRK